MTVDLISNYSILAPTLVGAFCYLRVSRVVKILIWLVFFTFLMEIASRIMFEMHINNLFLFHSYSFIEFGIISLIYYQLAIEKYWKIAIMVLFILFLLFSAVTLIYINSLTNFNSVQRTVESFLLIIYFFAFIRQYSFFEPTKQKLYRAPYRLTYGFLIYFSGTSFVFFFANEILKDQTNDFWSLHGLFNIFLNLTYCVVIITSMRVKSLD